MYILAPNISGKDYKYVYKASNSCCVYRESLNTYLSFYIIIYIFTQ